MDIFTRVDEGHMGRYVHPTHCGGGGMSVGGFLRRGSDGGILVAETGPLEHIVHVSQHHPDPRISSVTTR